MADLDDSTPPGGSDETTARDASFTQRLTRRLKEAAVIEAGTFTVAVLGGLVAQAAYAWGAPHGGVQTFALTNVFALASVMVGGLLGFLFGVPRFATANGDRELTVTPNTSLPNTNLEQISDWLTKILVGVGLVQIQDLSHAAGRLFAAAGEALGTGPSATAFAASLIIFATALGFMFGWLGTRTWVARLVTATDAEADQKARDKARDEAKAEAEAKDHAKDKAGERSWSLA